MLNRRCYLTFAALLIAAGVFFTGTGWGLPSKRVDAYLFAERTPWTGSEIQEKLRAAGEQWDDPTRGADVAGGGGRTAVGRTTPVVVNASDAQRAQIVRRYRLFTYQPDEMITLMSLARMHPAQLDLDPRLYQYGGLWIYGVAALLKVSSVLHLVNLRSGPAAVAYYLDNPEQFGRFYVVGRLYAAAWGLAGVLAVMRIVTWVTRNDWAAFLAALLYCGMPVVVNMAHEAKPHLPGTVLVLLAVLAGARYVRTGRWRDACGAGAMCGAAMGMVVSTVPIFGVLPAMALLRRAAWRRRLAVTILGALVGGCVYGITNPYVVAHQFWKRDVFQSNVGNSTGMYHVGRPIDGLLNEASLGAEGMTTPLAVMGVLGAGVLAVRAYRRRGDASPDEEARRAAGLLLAVPAILIEAQFALIGAGKPAEYGRFLMVPAIFLMIEAVVVIWTLACLAERVWPRTGRVAGFVLAIAATALTWRGGLAYEAAFLRDCRGETSRLAAARQIQQMIREGGTTTLVVPDDPAPYLLPPVDLFRCTIIRHHVDAAQDLTGARWQQENRGIDAGLLIRPVDEPGRTPISWADKSIEIQPVR